MELYLDTIDRTPLSKGETGHHVLLLLLKLFAKACYQFSCLILATAFVEHRTAALFCIFLFIHHILQMFLASTAPFLLRMASGHGLGLFILSFLLFPSATSKSTSDPSRCNALATLLSDKVFFPGDPGYNASDQSYFFAGARLSPACIVSITSATDVATTIQVLGRDDTGTSAPSFAIRGGGLLPNVGAANINGGVTIDLSAMNSINMNGDNSIVSVGSGARWGNVYKMLDNSNLGVTGARIATAGVGGYFVGGKPITLQCKFNSICHSQW